MLTYYNNNFSIHFLEPVCPEQVVIMDTLYPFFKPNSAPNTTFHQLKFKRTQTLAASKSLSFTAAAIYCDHMLRNCQVAMMIVTLLELSKTL